MERNFIMYIPLAVVIVLATICIVKIVNAKNIKHSFLVSLIVSVVISTGIGVAYENVLHSMYVAKYKDQTPTEQGEVPTTLDESTAQDPVNNTEPDPTNDIETIEEAKENTNQE